MFVVPILYRKSLSWNTLRARKRAEDKDAFSVGVKGQENGLLRKPKEITPPTPFASSDPVVKGKVSKAGRRCALVMLCVCQNPSPPPPHSVYVLCPNLSMCACVQTPVDTHTQVDVSQWDSRSGSQPAWRMNSDWSVLFLGSRLSYGTTISLLKTLTGCSWWRYRVAQLLPSTKSRALHCGRDWLGYFVESLEQMIDSEFSQKTRSDILLKIFLEW